MKLLLACLTLTLLLVSCKKDKNGSSNEDIFLGRWKTSYNDTISFIKEGGKYILEYDASMNPSLPTTTKEEYAYVNGKLEIRNLYLLSSGSNRVFSTFKWLEQGKSFEIQGMQWFMFLSSSQTYFTFTKIP